MRGIYRKGYGLISKRAMTESEITLTSKAIYAFLACIAGNETDTYISRNRIMDELDIGLCAYKNGMQKLEEREYIIRHQMTRDNSGQFSHNVIELNLVPSHLIEEITAKDTADLEKGYCNQHAGTIFALGWGMLPRAPMLDSSLSKGGKALYAYLCAYAGTGNEIYPKRERIVAELGIGSKHYYAMRKELERKNYITVIRRHVDGKYIENLYQLNPFPDPEKAADLPPLLVLQSPNPSFPAENEQQEQCGRNQPTVTQCGQNRPTVNDADNQCGRNRPTVKMEENIQETIPNGEIPNFEEEKSMWSKSTHGEVKKNSMWSKPMHGKPTHGYLYSITKTIFTNNTLIDRQIESICEKIDFEILTQFTFSNSETALSAISDLISAVAEVMTTTAERVSINSRPLLTISAVDVLQRINNTAVVNVIDRYLVYADSIQNPRRYLLSAIYNELIAPTPIEENVLDFVDEPQEGAL